MAKEITVELSQDELDFLDDYSGYSYSLALRQLLQARMAEENTPREVTRITSFSGKHEVLEAIPRSSGDQGRIWGHHEIEREADLVHEFLRRTVNHSIYMRIVDIIAKSSPYRLTAPDETATIDHVAEQERKAKAFEERFGEVEDGCIYINADQAEKLLHEVLDTLSPYQIEKVSMLPDIDDVELPGFRVRFKTVPVYKDPFNPS